MNKLRQYFTPFTVIILALVVVLIPTLALAADSGAMYWVEGFFWILLINLSGMFVSAGGIVFDFAINSFVIGFADYYTNSGVGFAVDRTWVTIRDFVNLFFIFGLVYIGFKMILDSDDSNTRRWLVNLIIAALLINFSLFITKFVIDFSNQICTQIAISGFGAELTGESATGIPNSLYEVDISTKVLDLMGITSYFGVKVGTYNGYGWGYIFGTTIMFLVTAFVFFAGAFMLIIRFAVLNLFMVLSPFMFIGWILPPLASQTSKYWDAFLKRAFFAPVYFLFLYFSLEIMKAFATSLPDVRGGNSGNMFNQGNAGAAIDATQSTLPFFILICIFLIASIVIAQKIGADAAGASQRLAGRLTAGTMGWMGRKTMGRVANKMYNSDRVKNMATSNNRATRLLGNTALSVGKYGEKQTFDVRGIIPKQNFVDLGTSSKSSYKKELDQAVKDAKDRAKHLGTIDTTTGTGAADVASLLQTLKDQASNDLNKARKDGEELEKDKLRSTDELKEAIELLTKEIKKEEEDLEKGATDKTLTEQEQVEAQASIDEKKLRLNSKQNNLSLAGKVDSVQKAKLELGLAQANGATPQEQTEARDALQKAEAAYKQGLAQRNSEVKSAKAKAQKDLFEAASKAEAQVKYQRQIALMEQKRNSIWNQEKLGRKGAVLGAVSSLSLGGAVIGAGAMGSYGDAQKAILEELEKEYGKDGMNKVKKEKQQKAAKQLIEAANDAAGKEEKGDDNK